MANIPFEPDDLYDDRRKGREQQKIASLLEELKILFFTIEEVGSKAHKYYQLGLRIKKEYGDFEQDNPEQTGKSSEQDVIALNYLQLLIVAYLLNIFVLFQAASYLVSLLVGSNSVLQGIGILLIPIALIGLQIYTGIDLYLAEDKGGRSLMTKRWGAKLIVLVSPLLILGTFIGETWGGLPMLHQVLLLIARLVLATYTDMQIVDNGKQGFEAQRFLLFGLRSLHLKRQYKEATRIVETSAFEAVQNHQTYQQKCTEFRHKFPEEPLTMPQFSAITRWVLERWQGISFTENP
ncbi:hypothetical protein [Adonisia turfae]|uniref:Uncharacterized protein n=1 Tax=Adonisia turfae CCMR0081 TaxID=2292702 RepID=A0A6M0RY28_9CYAN|nr:hypothetical protein [Adonisia turfae]NEZ61046.1 hypothetical protein [Adonisia turfae CCMR0081]